MRMTTCLPLLICCAATTAPAHAIVNVEGLHLSPPEAGFHGKAKIAYSGSSGNTDNTKVGTSVNFTWSENKWSNFLLTDYVYGKSFKVVNEDKAFVHERLQYQHSDGLAADIFMQMEENRFARLALRRLMGAGSRFTFGEWSDKKALHVGLGAFVSDEIISGSASDAGRSKYVRGNFYFVIKQSLGDDIRLSSTTYIQPELTDFNDYRVLEKARISFKITDRLSLGLNLDLSHDNAPPQNVSKTDASYSTSLTIAF